MAKAAASAKEKAAAAARQRARRAADPAGAKEYRLSYYKRNPWPQRRTSWRRQGINEVEAEAALRQHNGECNLCSAAEPRGKGGWQVDHEHATGRIRGVLCTSCNTKLALVDKIGLDKIRLYIETATTKGIK